MAKDIFFSYGHDEYKDFVLKVKAYLEKEGFEVFVDSDKLRSGDDWEYELEQGIKQRDKVVFFITPHAARRPDGYCLNEIAMAMALGKKIYPVMVRNHIVPLSLIRKQFLDVQSCVYQAEEDKESIFEEKMRTLVDALKKNEEFEHGDIQARVIQKLDPIDFQLDYTMHGNIVGREWVLERVDDWLSNHPTSKVLWFVAEAGYGKSAISAYLARHPKVMNVHFCSYNNPKKNKPENVIKTLAYSLQAQQIEGYLDEIQYVDITGKNVFELFEELIANPLSKVRKEDHTYILVIDGLDETLTDENRSLLTLLGSDEFYYGLPDFVKIIITSRPEPKIRQILSKLNPLELDTELVEHRSDCESFIRMKLYEKGCAVQQHKEITDRLMEVSDANMLYLTKFFEQEGIDWDRPEYFPQGLNGIYMNFFRRISPDIEAYDETLAPILEVMLAYEEAIPKELLQDILGNNRKKMHRLLGAFGSMLREYDDRIDFYHKSLKDWLVSESNEDYFVDIEEGKRRLEQFIDNLSEDTYKEAYLRVSLFNQIVVDRIYEQDKNLDKFFALIEHKKDYPSQVQLFNTLGAEYNLINQTQKAIWCLEYAVEVEQSLSRNGEMVDPYEYCKTLETLSILYWKVSRVDEALKLRKEYIAYAKQLFKDNEEAFAKEYSKALYLLSSAHVQLNNYEEAYRLRKKCLDIREKFYNKDPNKWFELYTTALLGLAGVYRRTNKSKQAILLGEKVVNTRQSFYNDDPKKWLNSYASSLQNLAIFYNGNGDVHKALDLSNKAVEIKRKGSRLAK